MMLNHVPLTIALIGTALARQASATEMPDPAALMARFEENRGQATGGARFLHDAPGYRLLLQPGALTLEPRQPGSRPIRIEFVGALVSSRIEGAEEMGGRSHYISDDPAKSPKNVRNFKRVLYRGLYPHIDLIAYIGANGFEYDWMVAPGGDPSRIRLRIDPAGGQVSLNAAGDLVVRGGGWEFRHKKPEARQGNLSVAADYEVTGDLVRLRLGHYDRGRELAIDPAFEYLTLIDGANMAGSFIFSLATQEGYIVRPPGGVAMDVLGFAYVTGISTSGGIFVVKMRPDGKGFVYNTSVKLSASIRGMIAGYGASSFGIAVDAAGNAYVTGIGFPLASFTRLPGIDAPKTAPYVLKLTPDGSSVVFGIQLGLGSAPANLLHATDAGKGIALDLAGNIYIAGETLGGVPTTPGAFQRERKTPHGNCISPLYADRSAALGSACSDAFVMKLDPAGRLIYSTYLSGTEVDGAVAIAVDAQGNAYVAGYTSSPDFPVTPGAFQTKTTNRAPAFVELLGSLGTDEVDDAFVVKLNPTGSALVYATLIGGSESDRANAIALDRLGQAYVTGFTRSDRNFPADDTLQRVLPSYAGPGASRPPESGYILALNSTGNRLLFSTWFGTVDTIVNGIALDAESAIYLTGSNVHGYFPTANGPKLTMGKQACVSQGPPPLRIVIYRRCTNAFLTKLRPGATGLLYSTYIGGNDFDGGIGVAVDSQGNAFVTGGASDKVDGVTSILAVNAGTFIAKMPAAPIPAGDPPQFALDGVVNAASFLPGAEQGSLATIFGKNLIDREGTYVADGFPLPREVWGTSITVNGIPAPIQSLYKSGSREQVTIQVPWEAITMSDLILTIVVVNNGKVGYQYGVPQNQPAGFFTWADNRAIALHSADWNLVTPETPALPGEIITLYGTGLSPMFPPGLTGLPAPSAPLSLCGYRYYVRIADSVAETLFCGLAPGLVGVMQINARIYSGTPPGEQDLRLEIDFGPTTFPKSQYVKISIGSKP